MWWTIGGIAGGLVLLLFFSRWIYGLGFKEGAIFAVQELLKDLGIDEDGIKKSVATMKGKSKS